MANEKPLTIADLVAALKEAGFATKDDLKALRQQVRDDAFADRSEFYAKMTKPEIDKLGKQVRTEMRRGFKQVDRRLATLEANVAFIKDDLKGLKADVAVIPTREEVNGLKIRVRKLEMASGEL